MAHRSTVFAAGAALYTAALLLPAYSPFDPRFSDTTYPGWRAFQVGWQVLGVWEPAEPDWWVLSAAWLANPATWVALVAVAAGRRRAAAVAAVVALALALQVLPRYAAVVAGHPGYWAWVLTAAVVLAGSLCPGPQPAESPAPPAPLGQ